MKKIIIFICLFCSCVSQQIPRKILPEFEKNLKEMPMSLQIVKQAYPDALVIQEAPKNYYYIIIFEEELKVVILDKSYKIINKYKIVEEEK